MADTKIFKFFFKKWNYKILNLGESSNFLSNEPHFFFFKKKILIKGFLGPLGAPKKFKILVNEINRVMCICQGIFQEQIQAD